MNLEVIPTQLSPETRDILEQVEALIGTLSYEVADMDTYDKAGEDRNLIGDLSKMIDDARKNLTRPLDGQKNAIMAFFKGPLDRLATAKRDLDNRMLTFKRQLDAERAAEQRRIEEEARRREEEERAKIAAKAEVALESGDTAKAERLLDRAESVRIPAPVLAPVKVPSTTTSTRKIWKWKVTNAELIPRWLLIPNETLLNTMVRDSKDKTEIPGIEVYFEEFLAKKSR